MPNQYTVKAPKRAPMKRPPKPGSVRATVAAMAQATDSEAFNRWFGDSKVEVPPPVAPDLSEIEESTSRLHNAIANIGAAIEHLSIRLGPVLRPPQSTAVDAGEVKEPLRSPVGASLDEFARRIYGHETLISDILHRLAV